MYKAMEQIGLHLKLKKKKWILRSRSYWDNFHSDQSMLYSMSYWQLNKLHIRKKQKTDIAVSHMPKTFSSSTEPLATQFSKDGIYMPLERE
jgi:hypothetical protein